jgi:hypothetical protein
VNLLEKHGNEKNSYRLQYDCCAASIVNLARYLNIQAPNFLQDIKIPAAFSVLVQQNARTASTLTICAIIHKQDSLGIIQQIRDGSCS